MPSRFMSVCGTGSKVVVNIDGFLLFAERIMKKKAKIYKALHGRLKSQRDGTGGKLTVDPPFLFRRERGTGKI